MGQGTRRHFTPEFKAQTVKLVSEGGHPLRTYPSRAACSQAMMPHANWSIAS
jgi:transposase-like protein